MEILYAILIFLAVCTFINPAFTLGPIAKICPRFMKYNNKTRCTNDDVSDNDARIKELYRLFFELHIRIIKLEQAIQQEPTPKPTQHQKRQRDRSLKEGMGYIRRVEMKTTDKIQRFAGIYRDGEGWDIEACPDGEYVRHDEHVAALEAAKSAQPQTVASMDDDWKRDCQYLLDVLDNFGFDERDLGEEDEAAIKGIRSALTIAPAQEPAGYVTQVVADAIQQRWQGTCRIVPVPDAEHTVPLYLNPPDQSARIAELEAEVEALKHDNASYVQANSEYLTRIAELEAALGFYANKANWDNSDFNCDDPGVIELVPSTISNDQGEIARNTLNGKGE